MRALHLDPDLRPSLRRTDVQGYQAGSLTWGTRQSTCNRLATRPETVLSLTGL
jgi:hypothetical protein